MNQIDPYQAPASQLGIQEPNRPTGDQITENMIKSLKQTRPWVFFLSIMGFLASAGMVFGGISMFGMSFVMPQTSGSEALSTGMFAGLSVFYILLAVLYFFPCLKLLRFGISIGRVQAGGGAFHFEEALKLQKEFWRLLGIMMIVFLSLYFVAIFVAVIAAFVAGISANQF